MLCLLSFASYKAKVVNVLDVCVVLKMVYVGYTYHTVRLVYMNRTDVLP